MRNKASRILMWLYNKLNPIQYDYRLVFELKNGETVIKNVKSDAELISVSLLKDKGE